MVPLAALALCACAGAGPSQRDVSAAAAQDGAHFALVDITPATVDVVSTWHRPSFSAVFGDYRSPKVQRVDVGDTVQINIWEAGSGGVFTTASLGQTMPGSRNSAIPEQVVARDGSVNVPYAGRIRVAGKTPQEIEELIVSRLQGKAAEPQALVTLPRPVSHSATVTGDVTNGARVPLNPGGDRVLDVIAAAGGIKSAVHETYITISREGTSLSVPMQALLSNTRENIYVRPGDVITVYRAPQSFTAVGATGRNAVVGFDASGLTLEEAVGKAGGLLDDRSDPRGVFVLRYEPVSLVRQYPGVPPALLDRNVVAVAYRIDVRDPTSLFLARRFAMRDKDILYVSTAPLTELEKVLRLVQMVTSPVVSGAAVHRALD